MTQEEIRLAVNSRLGKSVAEDGMTAEIQRVIDEISEMANWPALRTEADLAFTVGLKLKALPASLKDWDVVWIDGYRPMRLVDFKQLQRHQEQESPTSGRPLDFAPRGGSLYVYPLPDGSYTVKVAHWQKHPAIGDEDTGEILFGDEFDNALIFGTCASYLDGTGLTKNPKLKDYRDRFYAAIALLLPRADRDVVVTKPYRYGE
jgi:hypothetical protein